MSARRSALATAIAVLAVVMIAVIAALLWSPYGRVSGSRVLEVAVPIALTGATLFIVGLAACSVLPAGVLRQLSPGVVIGLGAAVAALTIAVGYKVAGQSLLAMWAVLAAALVILVVRGVRWLRSARPGIRSILAGAIGWVLRSGDLVTFAIVVATLFAVVQFGATSWTSFINDFQRYASSEAIWSGGQSAFAAEHPDAYGAGALRRAAQEKPAATGLMVLVANITGLESWRMLSVLVVLLLFVLLSALVTLSRAMFGNATVIAIVAAVPCTLSVVPMSRVFDAQVGQLQAAALAATVLALAAALPRASRRSTSVLSAVLLGLGAAAAIASNLTLMLGVLPVVLVLLAWIEWRRGGPARAALLRWSIAAATLLVASIPFVPGFLRSFSLQIEEGSLPDVPLPTPWSLLGLDERLGGADGFQNAITWLVVGGVALTLLVLAARRSGDARLALAVLGVGGATVLALTLRYGLDGYQVHKWLAIAFVVALPVLFAYGASRVAQRPLAATAVGVVVSAGALLTASHLSYQPMRIVPHELQRVTESDEASRVDVLNIALGNQYDDAMAALASPAETTIVVGATYSAASAPRGDTYLIRMDDATRAWSAVRPIGATFALAELDLSADAGRIDFAQPGSTDHLFEFWLEPTGPVARSPFGMLVVDPAGALADSDVTVTIEGTAFAAADHPRDVRFLVGEVEYGRLSADATEEARVTFTVPREVVADADGRLTIRIEGDGLSALDTGGTDARRFVFALHAITLEEAR